MNSEQGTMGSALGNRRRVLAEEVPVGYKRTEVGVIPEDWIVRPLSSCLSCAPGYGINAAAVPYDDRLPTYLRITDISEDCRFRPSPRVSVRNSSVPMFFLREGDLVFARTGASVGKSYRYKKKDGPLVFAGFLIRISPDPEKLEPAFLAYCVQSGRYWEWVATMSIRSGQPGINGQEYAMFQIPFPPISEQRAIAEVLSDVDGLLAALEALIAKKRAIKQAAMQQLLTGKTRLPGFSGEWKTQSLGSLARIKTGTRNNEDKVRGGRYPFYVRSNEVERINSYSYDCEAILVPGEGRIGEIFHYVRGRFDIHQRVYSISHFVPTVCAKFLYLFMMKNFGAWALQNTVKATVDSLRLPTFQKFEMHIPSSAIEQIAISAVLSDIEADIVALERRLAKILAIKQGMMQQLLTGQVRLVKSREGQ